MNRILVFALLGVTFFSRPAQSDVDAQTALNAHNQVRTTVNQGGYAGQPVPDPALAPMMWNQGLADDAAAYARQCVWAHSADRVNQGENLYASTDLASDIRDAADAWADEYQYYDFNTRGCTPGEQCGHYTQMVWEDSILVGCGDAVCQPLRWPDGRVLFSKARHQVCRYATAGNIVGNDPYRTNGEDASLVPTYIGGVLNLPYALIWPPSNIVRPVTASFSLASGSPLTFSLDSVTGVAYRADEEHVPIYDGGSQRLFLPNVDAFIGGNWSRRSAVLKYLPGSGPPLQMQLEHVQ